MRNCNSRKCGRQTIQSIFEIATQHSALHVLPVTYFPDLWSVKPPPQFQNRFPSFVITAPKTCHPAPTRPSRNDRELIRNSHLHRSARCTGTCSFCQHRTHLRNRKVARKLHIPLKRGSRCCYSAPVQRINSICFPLVHNQLQNSKQFSCVSTRQEDYRSIHKIFFASLRSQRQSRRMEVKSGKLWGIHWNFTFSMHSSFAPNTASFYLSELWIWTRFFGDFTGIFTTDSAEHLTTATSAKWLWQLAVNGLQQKQLQLTSNWSRLNGQLVADESGIVQILAGTRQLKSQKDLLKTGTTFNFHEKHLPTEKFISSLKYERKKGQIKFLQYTQ